MTARFSNTSEYPDRYPNEVALNEALSKAFARMTWMDEQDERVFGIRPVRPSRTAERLGVERYLKTYCKVTGEDYESWHDRITQMYQHMHYYDTDVSIRHVRQDIIDNFLYQEYKDQLEDADAIRSYSSFVMFVSAKAIISLLTEHMAEVSCALPPKRADAIAFRSRDDYDETDPVWYLSNVFVAVPGTWEAVQSLQQMYSDVVRVECTLNKQPIQGILPDDPHRVAEEKKAEDFEEDIRMQQAVQSFLAEEGTTEEIAQRYGFGQKRFRKYLKDNGFMRSHGGDRKGGSRNSRDGKRKAQ